MNNMLVHQPFYNQSKYKMIKLLSKSLCPVSSFKKTLEKVRQNLCGSKEVVTNDLDDKIKNVVV